MIYANKMVYRLHLETTRMQTKTRDQSIVGRIHVDNSEMFKGKDITLLII